MPADSKLFTALRNADAAGDVDAAKRIAGMIEAQRSGSLSAPKMPWQSGATGIPTTEQNRPVATAPYQPGTYGDQDAEDAAHFAAQAAAPPREPRPGEQELRSIKPSTGLDAFLASAGHDLFGAGDLIALGYETALNHARGGKLTVPEVAAMLQDRRRGLAVEHPGASYAGEAAGTVGSFAVPIGAELKMGTALPMLAAKEGAPIMNTIRGAAKGAGYGAATGAVQGGSETGTLEGAGTGAATGGLVGAIGGAATVPLASVSSIPARRAAQRITGETPTIRALARALKGDPDEIAKQFNAFKDAFGRPPRLVEIADPRTAETLARLAKLRPSIAPKVQAAEQHAANAGQSELGAAIRKGGGPLADTATATARRKTQMDAAMLRIGDRPVSASEDDLKLLANPKVREAADQELRQKIAALINKEPGAEPLTISDAEKLRDSLRSRAEKPGYGKDYNDLANAVRDMGVASVPEYGTALQSFGRRSQYMRALPGAAPRESPLPNAAQDSAPETFEGAFNHPPAAPNPGQQSAARAGMRNATRTELVRRAESSPQSAVELARDLAHSNSLQERLAIALPDARPGQKLSETERLRIAGTLRLKSAANLRRAASGAASSANAADEEIALATHAAIAGATGHHGGVWLSIARFMQKYGVSEKAAGRIADALLSTDEAEVLKAIRALKSVRATDDVIRKLVQGTAAGAGSAAATGEATP